MEFEKAKQILNKTKFNSYTDKEVREIIKLLEVYTNVWVNNLKLPANEKCDSIR